MKSYFHMKGMGTKTRFDVRKKAKGRTEMAYADWGKKLKEGQRNAKTGDVFGPLDWITTTQERKYMHIFTEEKQVEKHVGLPSTVQQTVTNAKRTRRAI